LFNLLTRTNQLPEQAHTVSLEDGCLFVDSQKPGEPFTRALVQQYRRHLERGQHLSASTINVRLAPIRKLAAEAADNGLLDPVIASGIARIKGVKRLGVRLGKWATPEQALELLQAPDVTTLKGNRDRAILFTLLGCALRRSELTQLRLDDLAEREGRWVFVDIKGKGKRVRTVTVPDWVYRALRHWLDAAKITKTKERIFRAVHKGGKIWGQGLTDSAVWEIVLRYAQQTSLGRLAPHDLRRSCAKLCRQAGGSLEQIQFLLGHASIQTTERYLGGKQELRIAVNDKMGMEVP
jgi:integrase